MIRLLCLAIGYLFGLFQTSYILGRVHGIDIREYGSHNAGTTNMLRTMGLKAGLLTFAGDCGTYNRIRKDSFYWYQKVIQNNSLDFEEQ